jgi:hypothetical protein
MCPRGDTHLTYMIDIALTTEFVLNDGVRWWEWTRSSDGRPEPWSVWPAVVAIASDEHA